MLKEEKKKNSEGGQDPDKRNPKRMTNFFKEEECRGKIAEYIVPSFMRNLQTHGDLKNVKVTIKNTRTQNLHNKRFY